MKISAGFLLIWVAVAVSGTPSKHHTVHGRNVQGNPGNEARPGQQNSGVIEPRDDQRASRRLPNDDNGSQDGSRRFGVPQALRKGREGRQGYGGTGNPNNDDVVESRRRGTIDQPPPFGNGSNNKGEEPASNVGQLDAFSGDDGPLGDLRRGYRSGYRPRFPSGEDSRSSEEDGPGYGRRYRPRVRGDDERRSSKESTEYGRHYQSRVRGDDGTRSSKESTEYGRHYRPRVRSDEDSSSSEEERPRWRERRQYPRHSGDDASIDEGRQFGQRRRAASAGFGGSR